MKFINVGYGNMAAAHRLIAVVSPEAAPVRRLVQDARDAGHVIDATCGHKTRAVLVTDSEHVDLQAPEKARWFQNFWTKIRHLPFP